MTTSRAKRRRRQIATRSPGSTPVSTSELPPGPLTGRSRSVTEGELDVDPSRSATRSGSRLPGRRTARPRSARSDRGVAQRRSLTVPLPSFSLSSSRRSTGQWPGRARRAGRRERSRGARGFDRRKRSPGSASSLHVEMEACSGPNPRNRAPGAASACTLSPWPEWTQAHLGLERDRRTGPKARGKKLRTTLLAVGHRRACSSRAGHGAARAWPRRGSGRRASETLSSSGSTVAAKGNISMKRPKRLVWHQAVGRPAIGVSKPSSRLPLIRWSQLDQAVWQRRLKCATALRRGCAKPCSDGRARSMARDCSGVQLEGPAPTLGARRAGRLRGTDRRGGTWRPGSCPARRLQCSRALPPRPRQVPSRPERFGGSDNRRVERRNLATRPRQQAKPHNDRRDLPDRGAVWTRHRRPGDAD